MAKKQIVNLEIRDYVIRYTESRRDKTQVERMGEHYIPAGIIRGGVIEDREQFERVLKTCVKKWRLKRKTVRLIMPDSLVFIRREVLPLNIAKNEIRNHIQFHLGDTIHLPFDESVFETVYIQELEDGHEISLISTDRSIANQYTQILNELGMRVESIDISPLSFYRVLYSHSIASNEDHLLLINYNVDQATFSAFRFHTPIFLQEFDLDSSDQTIDQLGPTLSKEDFHEETVMDELEDLIIEVERVERFYQYMIQNYEQQFTQIAITGDHPYLEDIMVTLEERFETPVVTIQDEQVVGPKGMTVASRFHMVYGMALKGGL
ncbi:type IV pilus biogenesis protein PilM [Alkalibacillus almallahensis]|uniref:type IV pilus biogenesis protein PilM n=1 Tax=Alkalibacillus almallahensis TaxID=1379154 RepID=UPI001422FDFE|nr:pilus assembly protein PilM [Alkalibacillus almallahensis]NIK11588.1 type IV pilus assembly protein PilM [Alkalibacillus almallahensis]